MIFFHETPAFWNAHGTANIRLIFDLNKMVVLFLYLHPVDAIAIRGAPSLCKRLLAHRVPKGKHSPVHWYRCAGIGRRCRWCSGACRHAAGGVAAMWSSTVASASGAVMCTLWLASFSK